MPDSIKSKYSKYPPIAAARFKRFDMHLPQSDDPELIVLKGHLLVEEILESFIKCRCQNPRLLDDIEVGFFVKSRIARALIGKKLHGIIMPENFWLWVDSLNTLRNNLAHSLDKKKLSLRIERFISDVSGPNKESYPDKPQIFRLRMAIVHVLSFMTAIETIVVTGKIPDKIKE